MRVLTLTPFYPSCADEAQGCFIAEPLPWLEEIGISNQVFAVEPFYRPAPSPTLSASKATWARYFAVPGRFGLSSAGSFLFARILSSIRRMCESHPIDLIHAHAPLPCGHAAALIAKELKIPFVVSVHGLDAFSTNQQPGIAGQWCERISRKVFASAARVVCVSKRVEQEVKRGADGAATSVVYNGVDPERFTPSKGESECTIVTIGDLIPTKGHDVLIRALHNLAKSHPNVRLQIIGTGPEHERLSLLARNLGVCDRLDFLGRRSRDQVAASLQECTLFALPSSYEGLGCVYLEAMASGKPVIGCRGQGIAEIISNGENGVLVEPNGVEEVAAAISRLLGDAAERRRMGLAARDHVLRSLTLQHQAHRLAVLYAECVA